MVTIVHTIYITKQVNSKQYNELREYFNQLGNKAYFDKVNMVWTTHFLKDEGFHKINLRSMKREDLSHYQAIEIQMNPIRLIEKGKDNRIEILRPKDVEEVSSKFNELIKIINPELPNFKEWTLNRIDFAVEFITPYVKQYINLFQRGDRPSVYFKELYNKTSKRKKQLEGSMYYSSKSTTINFYDKHNQLCNERGKGYEVDDKTLKDAENYLRLEVQCNKGKTDYIKQKLKFDMKHLKHFLDIEISKDQINYYYLKTVGMGDFYKLADATDIINKSKHQAKTKQNLIEVLSLCNSKRSVWKARDEYVKLQYRSKANSSKARFNRYIKQIRVLDINAVTIPQRWDMNYLRNPYNEIMNNMRGAN